MKILSPGRLAPNALAPRLSLVLLLAALSAASFPGGAGALDLSAYGSFGNLAMETDGTAALSELGEAFDPTTFFRASFSAEEALSDAFTFGARFERDPILRNILTTSVGFDARFAKITVGPFFGPFNTEGSVLSSGISTAIRLELPGVLFGSFRSDSTIGAGIAAPGDYVQERSEVSFGVYVPNVITSFRIASESFTEKAEADLTVADERTRYELIADVFKKNIPYTAHVVIGYQELKRSYIRQRDTATDRLGALIVGMDVALRVSPELKLMVGGEMPIYAWGIGALKSPSPSTALYQVNAGFTWTFRRDPKTGYAAPEEPVPAAEGTAELGTP